MELMIQSNGGTRTFNLRSGMDKALKLKLLEEKERLREGLPHLHGQKLYPWMREFFESQNPENILCSANQIGKSSIQIRKVIEWATNKSLWKKLWPHLKHPKLFFYFYPSSYLATVEFDNKWSEWLPNNEFKDDPVYGWKARYRAGYIQDIKFNSGVAVYFKTYSQDPSDLQAGSPAAVFIDEESPVEILPEITARLFATQGYFHAVMTPTLGQDYWREAIEVKGEKERFKTAFKRQVSMYDCLTYEDGSKSHWTEERIERIKNGCKSDAEIQRRVYGRFVLDSGLKYPSFNRDRNIIRPVTIPNDYAAFIGVDCGSGGDNHPSAVTFVSVSNDFKKGYVFKGRRFDNQITTASDLVTMVQQMKAEISIPVSAIFYDHAATDLREIAARMGESWIPAEKSHAIGEQALNVLFKNNMLQIFDTEELWPLVNELSTLKLATPKNQAKDDAADSLRYAVSKIPFDWSVIQGKIIIPEYQKTEIDLRREMFNAPQELITDIESEISAWQELYDIY